MANRKFQEWEDWANKPSSVREGRSNILPEIVSYIKLISQIEPSEEVFSIWESVSDLLIDQCLDNKFGIRYNSISEVPSEEVVRLLIGIVGLDERDVVNFAASVSRNKMVIQSNNLIRCATSMIGYVEIPNGVTSIADGAFAECEKITKVKLPSSIERIGERSFSGCVELESIEIAFDITTTNALLPIIPKCAFENCEKIKTLSIPAFFTTIKDGAFSYCTNLEHVDIPDSIKEIGNGAFASCGLSTFKCPKGIVEIGDSSFENNHLESIIIDSNIKHIGYYAFNGNPLSYIKINSDQIDVDDTAFAFCRPERIELGCTVPPSNIKEWFGGNGIVEEQLENVLRECTLIIPKGTKNKYMEIEEYKEFREIIEK